MMAELEKIAGEIVAARCSSCDGSGWIRVPAERKKYECGDCVSGMNISTEMFADWSSRLRTWIEKHRAPKPWLPAEDVETLRLSVQSMALILGKFPGFEPERLKLQPTMVGQVELQSWHDALRAILARLEAREKHD